jgi:excisionase family DNA binding protein
MSTGDVARLLHVSRVAVLLWVRAGKLKAARVPRGRYRIAPAEFQRFVADNGLQVARDRSPRRRILVVDDDASVRDAFEAALRPHDHEVVLAQDGAEAVRAVRRTRFDLIFLDILLPRIRGSTVLRSIKARDRATVVVLITGFPDHDETRAALKYGPAMLLRKPIKLADVEAVLDMVFRKA